MKVLLLGEYSNVHHTLGDALRRQGHDVLLISDGDGWKNYPRDIDLSRHRPGMLGSFLYVLRLFRLLPRMRGFDVVQLINPDLLRLKPRWNRWLFQYLKRNNQIISMGCFGDDYYVIERSQPDYVRMRQCAAEASEMPSFLDYTDFYAKGQTIDHSLNQQRIQGWIHSPKAELTRYVMAQADCLVACLYEYYQVYNTPEFASRLHYIPLPVQMRDTDMDSSSATSEAPEPNNSRPVHILLAVQKKRAAMKGTDQMEPLFVRLAEEHPEQVVLHRVESVPFAEYCRLLDEADVVVDQLYSYTPAMNALEAMARGKVVVSGGEESYYRFQQEQYSSSQGLAPSQHQQIAADLRPIINLRPFEPEQNYKLLCDILLCPERVAELKRQSLQFVQIFHQAEQVAVRYLALWQGFLINEE